MKYAVAALLLLFVASCAPPRVPEEPPRYLEKRARSERATERIAIAQTGSLFYYDGQSWSMKADDGSGIAFSRRFTSAHIFHYDHPMALTDIYKELIRRYGLWNEQLLESELLEVNGSVVIFNKISGLRNKRRVVLLAYGYSDDKNTIIVHGLSYADMLRAETESELVDFLNGFVAKN